ncbi:MAG: hypothetical protein OEZ08_10895 [Betaproteobacteria bacterium]|nr:hypothetical protein [Betaproteobacteria bacterium]
MLRPIPRPASPSTALSTGEKVAFLRRADTYPGRPARVETVETHMSWVFLTETFAYKLKKPVRYAFLDFSTLAARHRNCQRELRLNRRLAKEVYRGIVPLTLERGSLRLGGRGKAVDWLVKMHRLPAHRMLDAAIRDGTVSAADLRNMSRVLIAFYRGLAPVAVGERAYRKRFEAGVLANAAELGRPDWRLSQRQIEHVTRAQSRFLAAHGGLLEARARSRRIVEAHGDLRPEHICLTREPVIIDCLEFKREFRLLDPVDELAYLAMECDRLGSAAGNSILERYLDAAREQVPGAMILFYRAYRACLRAKITIWHLADHAVERDKWRRRAREYLDLASSYVARL